MSGDSHKSTIMRVTSVLPVQRIEPSFPFWEKVGFKEVLSVPEDDHLGFVILSDGVTQIMYQTLQSMKEDHEVFASVSEETQAFLFVQVADVNRVEKALTDFNQVMAYRETFYQSREIGYLEPGGHMVVFAEFPEE